MENFINHFCKPVIILIGTLIASIVNPIQEVVIVLSTTFVFNIFIGIMADVNVNHAHFSLKKAFTAIIQMMFLMVLVYYIHSVFDMLKMDAVGHSCIKWISIISVYFYTTNIMRNIKDIFPRNKLFAFLYELMTTQIFTRLKKALFMNFNNE